MHLYNKVFLYGTYIKSLETRYMFFLVKYIGRARTIQKVTLGPKL
jgi:hypothetical protein